jgi:glycosyltransferase involved in cell wall biosynthesis
MCDQPANNPDQSAVRRPPSALSVSLVWHSSFAALTGYSGSALAFALGLDERGVALRPLFLYGADHDEQVMMGRLHPRIRQLQQTPLRLDVPQVVYAPGDRFSKNSGAYRIGFTMLEADRLPASWVEQANQMDEVWTPTDWGAEVFRASGVRKPVYAVPLGIDATIFRPGAPRTRLAERTVFLSIFEWGHRKGWDILLRAYRAAFRPSDPVLLLLKIDCRDPSMNPLPDLARLLPSPAPAVGLLYNQSLASARLVELYQAADCFVLPTRGEGWGMPILEAMACGVPAIATDWSGPTAFLRPENGYPLPICGLVPTGSDRPFYQGARWADPDEAALVELLRHVAAHPHERQAKGRRAAADAQGWGWARGLDAISRRLAAINTP